MRVDLGNDDWAEVYSVNEMPRRVTVRMQEMIADIDPEQPGHAYMRDFERMIDTSMAMLTTSWSLDIPLGDDAACIHDLPQEPYEKLREATEEHRRKTGFFGSAPEEETPKARTRKKTGSETSSA